jgi:RNA polymerase sigma factor (sigma-70 family)
VVLRHTWARGIGERTTTMTVTTRSDAELLGQVRDGDDAALGELYVRHRAAALRLARSYGAGADAEDVVNEGFERVMGALRRGRGPADAFRPYLFVTVRRLAADRGGADHGTLDEVPEAVEAAAAGETLDLTERALVAEAFADLPDRWQTVLWHTAVEGQRPREVARAVGMPANTVAVLAHRARERLRQRYLQAHILTSCPEGCAPHRARLGAHVRGGLTRRHSGAVDTHLAGCADCRRLADELGDVNRLLARAVVPVFALAGEGGALVAGSTGGGAGGAAAGAAGGSTGLGTMGGAGLGAGSAVGAATVAKLAAAIAAVVGLVAVSPVDVGDGGDRPTAEAAGPAASERDDPAPRPGEAPSTTTAATASPTPGRPPDAAAAAPSGADPVAGFGVELDEGVAVDVTVGPVPGVSAGVQASAGLASGVEVAAAWHAGLLGSGTLAVDVANPAADALVGAQVVVDLSPGARPTSLLGTTCRATDPGLVGAVLSLLASLTCDLAAVAPRDAATLEVPLAVLGSGQSATIRVLAGGVDLASTTVALAR